MIRSLALLCLMVAPVAAQEADPVQQMIEGFSICMNAAKPSGPPLLQIYTWSEEPVVDGISMALPPGASETFVIFDEDKTFCSVESMTLGTDKMLETLTSVVELGGFFQMPAPGTSGEGCATYDFGDGMVATLTSGGETPTCTSQANSAMRFDFAALD